MTSVFMRPDADSVDGSWLNEASSNSSMYVSVDDTSTGTSDADYIRSSATDGDRVKFRLSDPSTTITSPVTVRYRALAENFPAMLTGRLFQSSSTGSGTQIAYWEESPSTSFVTYTRALSTTEFDVITDSNDLFVEFEYDHIAPHLDSKIDLNFATGTYYEDGIRLGTDSANLMLHMNGTDASTTFTDATGRHTVTASGQAQLDTAQFKFGTASALFDGTGDGLSLDGDAADFCFGTDDFTVDCWFRLNTTGQYQTLYQNDADTGTNFILLVRGDSNVLAVYNTVAGYRITGGTTLTTGVWYHAAVIRASGTLKLWLNGTQEGGSYSDSNIYTISSGFPKIGLAQDGSQTYPMNGWIDELRVVKGTAIWTANFTSPTVAYDVGRNAPLDYLSISRASVGYGQTIAGTLAQFSADTLRITDKGLLVEGARTNVVLWNRDLTNILWVAVNITAVKDQIGPDGVSNSASSITASAGNGTILQTIVLASSDRYQSAWVKRITGSGTINMTMDNGSTWTAITVTSSWTQVTIPTQTLANPIVGFQIVTNGDKIAVDFVQNEDSTFASSPIATTTTSVTRAADSITSTGNLTTLATARPMSMVMSLDQIVVPGQSYALAGSYTANDAFISVDSDTTVTFNRPGSLVATLGTPASFSSNSGAGKVGFAFTASDRSIVANAGTVATDALDSTFPNFALGRSEFGINKAVFRRVSFWDTRLANTVLQALSTA